MCDPITIGSMALGAAGNAVNGYEANRNAANVINARNAATNAELGRQKAYGEKSRASFDNSMSFFAPGAQDQRLADNQSAATNVLQNNAPVDVGSISSASAPRVVGESEGKATAAAAEKGASKNAAQGRLAGYGQTFFNNNLDLSQNARDIDMVGDFAKTSAAVNQIEQRAAANNAAGSISPIGDIMKFLGGVGAAKGASLFGGGGGGFTPFQAANGGPLVINRYGAGLYG